MDIQGAIKEATEFFNLMLEQKNIGLQREDYKTAIAALKLVLAEIDSDIAEGRIYWLDKFQEYLKENK